MAKDKIHRAVRKALEKDAWKITADPFSFRYKRIQVHADLEAERIFEAENEGRKIAVGIKSFLGASAIDDFENALANLSFIVICCCSENCRIACTWQSAPTPIKPCWRGTEWMILSP